MSEWANNPDAVAMAKKINSSQACRLPYPPYNDLMLTDKAFAELLEGVVPDRSRRLIAVKQLYDATSVYEVAKQFETYLSNENELESN